LSALKKNIDPKCARILLIEDHAILRDGLRALLDLELDLEIVGEAESAAAGCIAAEAQRPHLVITDIAMPGESGISIIPRLKEQLPGVRVLVLTAHCTDEYVRAALEAGADGYILKDSSREVLLEGIHAILDGRQYFCSGVTNRVVAAFLGNGASQDHADAPNITQREMEVLVLIANGASTKSIARKLNLSVKTIEKHRSNLMHKLDLHNTAAVTLYAVRHNLVAVEHIDQ
jgi:DNA-binding NarL/FixJ family response regulator